MLQMRAARMRMCMFAHAHTHAHACPCSRAGNGSMVGAIVGSTKREPLVVGKPSDFMLDNIANTFKLQRSQICMVGDRLDTDIMFGKNGGLTTCLVLSGACVAGPLSVGHAPGFGLRRSPWCPLMGHVSGFGPWHLPERA